MDKNELWKLLRKEEERIEKRRQRRGLKATLGFSIWYFIILYWTREPSGFLDMLGSAVFALILGFFHLVLNGIIFSQINDIVVAENRHLEELRNKLNQ